MNIDIRCECDRVTLQVVDGLVNAAPRSVRLRRAREENRPAALTITNQVTSEGVQNGDIYRHHASPGSAARQTDVYVQM